MTNAGKVVFLVAIVSLFSLTFPRRAWAQEGTKSLAGTWKLTGWTLRIVGETSDKEPFGANPKGRLIITPDGYWMIIITAADRRPAKTAEEKVALFDSVLAYSGKYTVEGNKITVQVDMSANEVFTGASHVQTRFFALDGDRLTVRTPQIASAALPGKKIVGTNIFERER
jgi:hypothetical protein